MAAEASFARRIDLCVAGKYNLHREREVRRQEKRRKCHRQSAHQQSQHRMLLNRRRGEAQKARERSTSGALGCRGGRLVALRKKRLIRG